MTAKELARCIDIDALKEFSPEARVTQEVAANNDLLVRMNCYEPGQVTPMHKHPKDDEILYILEGEGAITFKDQEDLPVKAGELVCLPADQYHRIVAGPDKRMALLYFIKPKYGSVRTDDKTDAPAIKYLPGQKP